MDILHELRYGLLSLNITFCCSASVHGIPVYSGVGGGVVNGCELGDVSRGLESLMRGKVPREMENS